MKRIISYVLKGMCVGSFIYLISLIAYDGLDTVSVRGIYSMWIASAAIGVANIVYDCKWSKLFKHTFQFGVVFFSILFVNLWHGWIEISFLVLLDKALFVLFLMLVSSAINYLLAARDSKLINQLLNKK
ncbi:DUF3021 family protein [Salinicoccus sesuvii]|uniref:DUF3021 family protein n=1 Tax=Salinicoccus sesuvii TaxID=868281 RepID=A0ABV7N3P2_9STAP